MPAAPGREEIRTAYRLLLGREADPGGLEHYAAMAEAGRLDFARLREIFLASEEYRTRARRRRTRVEIGGAVVVVDAEEPAFGSVIARTGRYETHVAAAVARCLSPGACFVDVGANVGAIALPAARIVGPKGRVIGFEPDPSNAALFLAGVAANGFGHVRLFSLALSDRPAVFALQGGSNGYLVPAGETDIAAQALPGDEILAGEARIDLIKLDIEGHEPRALAGLAATLARHRPWILTEFNPRCLRDHAGTTPAAFAAQLFALAPRLEVLQPDGPGPILEGAEALLSLLEARDRDAAAAGLMPPGMLHLDLLLRVGGE